MGQMTLEQLQEFVLAEGGRRIRAAEIGNIVRMAHNVLHLTTLSLLVDRGIVSLSDIAGRVEQVRGVMPEDYRNEEVGAALALVTGALSHVYGAKPKGWTPVVIKGGRDDDVP